MQFVGIIYIAGMFLLTSLLAIGGFVLQREKYWVRIWEDLGKPEVKSIKELKAYVNKQPSHITPVELGQSSLGTRNK
jgi:hypothetical protein